SSLFLAPLGAGTSSSAVSRISQAEGSRNVFVCNFDLTSHLRTRRAWGPHGGRDVRAPSGILRATRILVSFLNRRPSPRPSPRMRAEGNLLERLEPRVPLALHPGLQVFRP